MASDKKAPGVIKNKKAYHDYHVLQTFEAGIVLLGSEVKSIRAGNAQLKGNFIQEWRGELLVEHMHISPYKFIRVFIPVNNCTRIKYCTYKQKNKK